MSAVLALAQELINRRSITPNDAGCQDLLAQRLKKAGFSTESFKFGEVHNLWAHHGQGDPVLVFAGHTDVVPPGPESEWHSPPFTATIKDHHLYGRGSADMKGALAAMVVAAETFIAMHPDHPGSVAFLITSDEEGLAQDGTQKLVAELQKRQQNMTWCVVGEAASEQHIGDTIKVGRRGFIEW